jgi:hypothetical protein
MDRYDTTTVQRETAERENMLVWVAIRLGCVVIFLGTFHKIFFFMRETKTVSMKKSDAFPSYVPITTPFVSCFGTILDA